MWAIAVDVCMKSHLMILLLRALLTSAAASSYWASKPTTAQARRKHGWEGTQGGSCIPPLLSTSLWESRFRGLKWLATAPCAGGPTQRR